jgi:protein SCO1/2
MLRKVAENGRRRHRALIFPILLWLSLSSQMSAAQSYPALGLVLSVDSSHHSMVASCNDIPGYMAAKTMPFAVPDAKDFDVLRPGMLIDFTIVADANSSHAKNIRPHVFQSGQPEPVLAQGLELLQRITTQGPPVKHLAAGEAVPDFSLIDQNSQPIKLSQFYGKVVAITFLYTQCPLPDRCFLLANNFEALQRRFASQLGEDLVLLSISFDPIHDQPDVLSQYAAIRNADPKGWHFLTGPPSEIDRVCHMFNMNYWPNMGMFTHTLHTIVIDRQGRVVANLEGNQFSAQQLGDLVETTLNASK